MTNRTCKAQTFGFIFSFFCSLLPDIYFLVFDMSSFPGISKVCLFFNYTQSMAAICVGRIWSLASIYKVCYKTAVCNNYYFFVFYNLNIHLWETLENCWGYSQFTIHASNLSPSTATQYDVSQRIIYNYRTFICEVVSSCILCGGMDRVIICLYCLPRPHPTPKPLTITGKSNQYI